MRGHGSWSVIGLLVGASVGALWGWGAGGAEAGDSAIGTGLMLAPLGAVIGLGVSLMWRGRRKVD